MGAAQQVLASYGGFVGPLDTLIAQGATLLYAGSVRRLLSSWAGNAMRLQGNGTGTPIAAIPFLPNGDLDLTAAAAAAAAGGGTAAAGETWYDQSGRLDATQTTIANQMPFSTDLNAKGGWGKSTSSSSRWFQLNLGTLSYPAMVNAAVSYAGSGSGTLLATTASTANRYCRLVSGAMQQNWGTALNGTASEVSSGAHVFGWLANGASSKNILDGTTLLTGDAGNAVTDMAGGRIGGAIAIGAWLSTTGNGISEFIVFANDPTGLAGWSDFVTAQKSYFGVA